MRTIIVATDLSARADRAVDRAETIAAGSGARLLFVHVVDDDLPADMRQAQTDSAWRILRQRAQSREIRGLIETEIRVIEGDPFARLNEVAVESGAQLIVAGDYKRTLVRRFVAETTIERLVRISSTPVLIVRSAYAGPYRKAIVGVETEAREEALALGSLLGAAAPREILFVHAFDPVQGGQLRRAGLTRANVEAHKRQLVDNIRASLKRAAFAADAEKVSIKVVEGDPVDAIEAVAEGAAADLVVATTHARGGLARFLIGSVTSGLIRRGTLDFLIIPPGWRPAAG